MSSTAWIIKYPTADSLHLNLGYTRSLVPNAEFLRPAIGDCRGMELLCERRPRSQWQCRLARPISVPRSRPSTSHPPGLDCSVPTTVFTLGAFVRRDDYNYYPSANPFADLGAPGLQSETVSQRSHAHQCGSALGYLLRKGNSTILRQESPTNRRFSTRMTAWHRRSDPECALPGLQRQSAVFVGNP